MFVRQCKFDALGQRGFQRLLRLVAPVGGHRVQIVLACVWLGRHAGLETGPDQGYGLGVVLQQLVLTGQAKIAQGLQRRATQQRGKPAVEGAYLHRPPGQQQGLVQAAQGLQLRGRGLVGQAAVDQLLAQF